MSNCGNVRRRRDRGAFHSFLRLDLIILVVPRPGVVTAGRRRLLHLHRHQRGQLLRQAVVPAGPGPVDAVGHGGHDVGGHGDGSPSPASIRPGRSSPSAPRRTAPGRSVPPSMDPDEHMLPENELQAKGFGSIPYAGYLAHVMSADLARIGFICLLVVIVGREVLLILRLRRCIKPPPCYRGLTGRGDRLRGAALIQSRTTDATRVWESPGADRGARNLSCRHRGLVVGKVQERQNSRLLMAVSSVGCRSTARAPRRAEPSRKLLATRSVL